MNGKEKSINLNNQEKSIITEEGLFYSNFSDSFKAALATIEGSPSYSEHLVWLSENYGIKVGQPQPDTAGNIAENSIGIYIVDYPKYLSDMKEKLEQNKGRNR